MHTRTNGQTDGRTDGQTPLSHSPHVLPEHSWGGGKSQGDRLPLLQGGLPLADRYPPSASLPLQLTSFPSAWLGTLPRGQGWVTGARSDHTAYGGKNCFRCHLGISVALSGLSSQFPLLFKARQSSLQPALTPGLFALKMCQSPAAHLSHDAVQCSGPYQSQTETGEGQGLIP